MQNPPGEAGIELSNWNWKVVRQFLKQSFDLGLSRSSCLNYLHRLGFVLKRPKKRLLKAKDEERKAFVLQYSQIREEAQESGAKIFFVDEAHFRADGGDLRGKWVLKGEAALVDSTSPRLGREGLLLLGSLSGDWGGGSHGNSWKQQCRDLHGLFTAAKSKLSWTSGRLGQWTSPPRSSDSQLFDHSELASARLVALPAYSPDFNADEAVWDWAREEVTANECHGTKAQVQEKMNQFFGGLAHRKEEVKRRCRTRLQARADALIFTPAVPLPSLPNVVPTLALV